MLHAINMMNRCCLTLGLIIAAGFFVTGRAVAANETGPKNPHLYLLIGDADMAGNAAVPDDAGGVIDRCYLLNDKNQWEPAREPLNRYSTIDQPGATQGFGPGFSFVKKMLEQNKDARIGLVVNAGRESKIADWLGKSKLYWGARGRMKVARQSGTIKGVLWMGGKGDSAAPDGYLAALKTLIGNLRTDFDDPHLPFIAGQLPGIDAINEQIAKLPGEVDFTAFVSSQGLKNTDGGHLDAAGELQLGVRFAEKMIALRKQADAVVEPKMPTDIKFIDAHVHALESKPGGLDPVIKWMDSHNVERCIVSPLDNPGSRARTDEERRIMLANFAKYKGRIYRMCIIDPQEVNSVDQAVAILKREMADGAVGFGEHYGRGLNFDDPKNLRLYAACEQVGLPVMFHIDQNKNMVGKGMARVDRVLKMYPKCIVVAHAYWWRQLANGTCDRQLREHPNLYADLSGIVVPNVLNRDRKYAREFLIRNADKLLFGTDEGWWSFGSESKMMPHYTFFEGLDLPDDVRYKIYRGNAEKVFGLPKDQGDPGHPSDK